MGLLDKQGLWEKWGNQLHVHSLLQLLAVWCCDGSAREVEGWEEKGAPPEGAGPGLAFTSSWGRIPNMKGGLVHKHDVA